MNQYKFNLLVKLGEHPVVKKIASFVSITSSRQLLSYSNNGDLKNLQLPILEIRDEDVLESLEKFRGLAQQKMPKSNLNERIAFEYIRLDLTIQEMEKASQLDGKAYKLELNNAQQLEVQLNEFLHYRDDYAKGFSVPLLVGFLVCMSFSLLYRLVPLLESRPDWLVLTFSLFVVLLIGIFQYQTSKSVRLISLIPTITMADGDAAQARINFWMSSGVMLTSAILASFFIEYLSVQSLAKLRLDNLAPILCVVILTVIWIIAISTDAKSKIHDVSSMVLDRLESQGPDVETEILKLRRDLFLCIGRVRDISLVQSMRDDWLSKSHEKLEELRGKLFHQ